MEKAFVYGMSVEGCNFTDREKERKRIRQDFENGINVILISPRRMGKTSLIKKVMAEMDNPGIKIVYMDIYDCRNEYDFYNRFASAILRSTSNKVEPKDYSPEEILQLPEVIAREKGYRIVVCIDEFQQVGEFPDSLNVQKRLRGVWQHHQQVSYCFFGSKRHLMENIFQSKRMPFYQFGEMMHLDCIPTEYWVPFICQRFEAYGKHISEQRAAEICHTVQNYSSYVQQLAWNVMAETDYEADDQSLRNGIDALLAQCSSLFVQQTESLTTYQLNFIRLLCKGFHTGFASQEVSGEYPLGTKSNIDRIKRALLDREIITLRKDGVYIADSVFALWFKKEMI